MTIIYGVGESVFFLVRLVGFERAIGMKVNKTSLQAAAIEYLTAIDKLQCHVHLRIDADGEAYVSEDTGYCVSQAEYNKEEGASKTVKHAQGHGQCNLPDGWEEDDYFHLDTVEEFIESIYEDLKQEGIEVEEVGEESKVLVNAQDYVNSIEFPCFFFAGNGAPSGQTYAILEDTELPVDLSDVEGEIEADGGFICTNHDDAKGGWKHSDLHGNTITKIQIYNDETLWKKEYDEWFNGIT